MPGGRAARGGIRAAPARPGPVRRGPGARKTREEARGCWDHVLGSLCWGLAVCVRGGVAAAGHAFAAVCRAGRGRNTGGRWEKLLWCVGSGVAGAGNSSAVCSGAVRGMWQPMEITVVGCQRGCWGYCGGCGRAG